jgi:hypothetical protein
MHAIMLGTQISQSHRNGRYGNSNRDITVNKVNFCIPGIWNQLLSSKDRGSKQQDARWMGQKEERSWDRRTQ